MIKNKIINKNLFTFITIIIYKRKTMYHLKLYQTKELIKKDKSFLFCEF
jgi:3-methyladenine DNA glycosylase AlkD